MSASLPESFPSTFEPPILQCTTNLQQNGEATSKYQDLIIELESLERALSRLYSLKPAEHELVHLAAIRAAASACKRPLQSFLAKIEKFEKRLGTGNAKGNHYKGAGRRIQFNVAFDEDVKELRSTLASHVLTINTLLMTQMLDSITAAEMDRETNVESLKTLYEAHTTLLENIGRRQDKVSADLSKHWNTSDALKGQLDSLHLEGARASIKSEEQNKILEAIKQKIESVKKELEITNTPDKNSTDNGFTKAMAVTSNIVYLVLSGAMLTSAHTLTSQARDMSTIAQNFESRLPRIEHSIEQQSVGNGGSSQKEENEWRRCNSAVTRDIEFEGSTKGSDTPAHGSNGYEKSLSAVKSTQEHRFSGSQESPSQSKVVSNQCLSPYNFHSMGTQYTKDEEVSIRGEYDVTGKSIYGRLRICDTEWNTVEDEWMYKVRDSRGRMSAWLTEQWLEKLDS